MGSFLGSLLGGLVGGQLGILVENVVAVVLCANFGTVFCAFATTPPPSPDIRETSFSESLRTPAPAPTPNDRRLLGNGPHLPERLSEPVALPVETKKSASATTTTTSSTKNLRPRNPE